MCCPTLTPKRGIDEIKVINEDKVSRLLGLYELGFPSGEIASKLGRSESSVRLKVLSMGLSSRRILRQIITSELPAPLIPEERIPEETATLEEEAIRLRAERELELREQRREDRSQVDDAKREILEQRIVDEFRSHLCDLPQSISVRLPPIVQASPSADVAVLVVGDVHIGEVVDPAESEGLGTYNPAVMIARVHHLQQEVMRILKNHPPKKLLLLFAGDMLHGQLGHTMEDDLTLPIAIQTDLALHTFFPFVAGLSRVVPKIEIHGVVGNHGRWPGMRKMPTDRRWSNLDSILYMSLAALCEHSGLSNVFYELRISSRRMIDVDNFRIELLHVRALRTGAEDLVAPISFPTDCIQEIIGSAVRVPTVRGLSSRHPNATAEKCHFPLRDLCDLRVLSGFIFCKASIVLILNGSAEYRAASNQPARMPSPGILRPLPCGRRGGWHPRILRLEGT